MCVWFNFFKTKKQRERWWVEVSERERRVRWKGGWRLWNEEIDDLNCLKLYWSKLSKIISPYYFFYYSTRPFGIWVLSWNNHEGKNHGDKSRDQKSKTLFVLGFSASNPLINNQVNVIFSRYSWSFLLADLHKIWRC